MSVATNTILITKKKNFNLEEFFERYDRHVERKEYSECGKLIQNGSFGDLGIIIGKIIETFAKNDSSNIKVLRDKLEQKLLEKRAEVENQIVKIQKIRSLFTEKLSSSYEEIFKKITELTSKVCLSAEITESRVELAPTINLLSEQYFETMVALVKVNSLEPSFIETTFKGVNSLIKFMANILASYNKTETNEVKILVISSRIKTIKVNDIDLKIEVEKNAIKLEEAFETEAKMLSDKNDVSKKNKLEVEVITENLKDYYASKILRKFVTRPRRIQDIIEQICEILRPIEQSNLSGSKLEAICIVIGRMLFVMKFLEENLQTIENKIIEIDGINIIIKSKLEKIIDLFEKTMLDKKMSDEKFRIIFEAIKEQFKLFLRTIRLIYNNDNGVFYDAAVKGNKNEALHFLKGLREQKPNDLLTANTPLGEKPVLFILASVGHVDWLDEFLKFVRIDTTDESGNTALHIAAISGHLAFCDALISKGILASKNRGEYQWPKNKFGYTPLHSAAIYGQTRCIHHLVTSYQGKTILLLPTINGDTIVHLMVRHRHVESLNTLLKLFPTLSVCVQNYHHQDPLMLAIENRDDELVKSVLEHQVDLANRDAEDRTALHLAVRQGLLSIVKLLLDKGASLNLIDKQGKKPQDYVSPHSEIGIYFAHRLIQQQPRQHFSQVKSTWRNLVFQGGSVRGLACPGALRALVEEGICRLDDIQRVGGASAGAINALLVGLGYSLDEIDHLVGVAKNFSFEKSKGEIER